MENQVQKPGVSRGPWLHNTAIFKDNPGKKLTRYGKLTLGSYYFYEVKLKLSSPKLDRQNSWERGPGDTPPQELVMLSRWGHLTFEKYLLLCLFECMSF